MGNHPKEIEEFLTENTSSGLRESHVYDIIITKEALNHRLE
jgi:hypothetical protein